MSDRRHDDPRYSHTSESGGSQDQGERKDEGWNRRQGGSQSHPHGSGEPRPHDAPGGGGAARSQGTPPPGTNTQGSLAGIGEASRASEARLPHDRDAAPDPVLEIRERDGRGETASPTAGPADPADEIAQPGEGTDQPPRMGGPLGPDRDHPHLPQGLQNADDRGSGARGFDEGVDASRIGTLHQGVRPEDESAATLPGEPEVVSGDAPDDPARDTGAQASG